MKNNLGIAKSNTLRRGQIKACLAGNAPLPIARIAKSQSVRSAEWNVAAMHSAVDATITTLRIHA